MGQVKDTSPSSTLDSQSYCMCCYSMDCSRQPSLSSEWPVSKTNSKKVGFEYL